MKLVRILLSILVLMVCLVVFAVGALVLFIDPNKLKPTIIAEVTQRTGIQLTIDGNLSWAFYPHLSIKAAHMRVTMPNQTTPFADLYDVKIATKLSQLWSSSFDPMQGEVRIDHLNIMNVQIHDAYIALRWWHNILTLAPVTAELYDGTLEGIAEVSHLEAVPRWNWDMRATNVQIKALLHDVQDSNAKLRLSGTGNIRLRALTQGKTKDDLLRYLNGQSEINITNGIVDGIDINYLVQTADALLNKKPLDLPSATNQTLFQSLTGTASIKDGIVTTNNLLLSAPSFTTKGEGTIDLINNSLNLQLNIVPMDTIKTKWMVPVLVSGAINDPSIRLDAQALRALVPPEDLEKVKEKVQEEVKKLPKKADKLLKKLLGQ